jgi:hypothetical protein
MEHVDARREFARREFARRASARTGTTREAELLAPNP